MRSRIKNAPPVVAVKLLIVLAAGSFIFSFSGAASGQDPNQNQSERKPIDPKAWGGNHAGKPLPEYVTGDECLFCHRNDIGPTWQKNAHGVTVRQREDAPDLARMLEGQPALADVAKQIEYFLGSRHRVRFLKKEGYGKFAMLNAQAVLGENGQAAKLVDHEKLAWDKEKFANRCAGCHTTAVDSTEKTFSAFGLDCYTCHGVVDLNHTKDTSLVLLSKKRRSEAKVITSLCAQCHLREAKSKSTGLPYPNNFVAGDNLFQDFDVDWAKADDEKLNAGDRHVWRNVRDVALYGNESITCLNCHQVHGNSSFKHRRVLRAPICAECHQGEGFKNVKRYEVRSSLCEY
ncbi:MAG: multiheme c-type cytochrome [Blastocatellia bacterium]